MKSLNEDGGSVNGGDNLLNFEMEPMSIKMEGGSGGAASSSSSTSSTAGTSGAANAGGGGDGTSNANPDSSEGGASDEAGSSSQMNKIVEYIPGSDPEKPFLCKTCEKPFTSAAHLAIHTRVHTGERSFHCTKCPKSFGND